MFFYAFRVNSALALLGVSPSIINPLYRQGMQRTGRQAGHSPQEVALYIAAQLPAAHRVAVQRVESSVGPIRKWIRQRKINPDASEMREALERLGLWDLM
jgi:hypothetical protein